MIIDDINNITIYDLKINNIEIITPGKCGSDSFSSKLLHPDILSNQYKNHHHNLDILKNILEDNKDTLIISGIRNPLKRNISYFFEKNIDKYNDIKLLNNKSITNYSLSVLEKYNTMLLKYIEEDNINKLIKLFFIQDSHFHFNEWFNDFFKITKININKNFDKEKGYTLYKLSNNNYILFYTIEKLNDNINIFNNFFNIIIEQSNITKNKYNNNIYLNFQKKIRFNFEYKKKLLDTYIMNYFYTKKDIIFFYKEFDEN